MERSSDWSANCRSPFFRPPRPDVRRMPRLRRASGQGLVEYGLILALTSAFTAVILGALGGTMAAFLAIVASAIDAATGG